MWVKIDDDFYHHPKIRQVGPLGVAMQVAALCYSNHFNTHGFIPYGVLETLVDLGGIEWWNETLSASKVAEWLVNADVWSEDKDRCGYLIHDYKTYQEPTLSEKRAAAGRSGGLAKAGKTDSEPRRPTLAIVQQPPSNHPKQEPPVPVPDPVYINNSARDAKTSADWYEATTGREPKGVAFLTELENLDYSHGPDCVAWAFGLATGKQEPWAYAKRILAGCLMEGHGPRGGRPKVTVTDERLAAHEAEMARVRAAEVA